MTHITSTEERLREFIHQGGVALPPELNEEIVELLAFIEEEKKIVREEEGKKLAERMRAAKVRMNDVIARAIDKTIEACAQLAEDTKKQDNNN